MVLVFTSSNWLANYSHYAKTKPLHDGGCGGFCGVLAVDVGSGFSSDFQQQGSLGMERGSKDMVGKGWNDRGPEFQREPGEGEYLPDLDQWNGFGL
jgi:hypothetical protein